MFPLSFATSLQLLVQPYARHRTEQSITLEGSRSPLHHQPIMYVVLFETKPSPAHQSTYMSIAASLKPSLALVDGFLSNVRYRSLTRPGWLLSLSTWETERALVRWRAAGTHHGAQARARGGVMEDYHLRVGQVVAGDGGAEGLDTTEVGAAACVMLVYGRADGLDDGPSDASELAASMGLSLDGRDGATLEEQGLVAWDVFQAVDGLGELVLLSSWRDEADSSRFHGEVGNGQLSQGKVQKVRVLRDYGKYDRREAPQFFEDAPGGETTH
ncbi:hypothetical protein GGTG_12073 [Gaeumannomyces tritici R3-111a-1]|uniref:ABM domain-containing protein n=1 Tax=Gaeumannomyces tritici (strain R3-111a-1) TaxID=644352 RepID=J3PEZ4_GAET3|nr:hypothetical protein GGTG_12073 [Gaeumannomyces tritici R3-111a-1]EJT71052.1 hypothetical protein GGTG_12073 [Gaeumannomyces tritici R3-111a-1]